MRHGGSITVKVGQFLCNIAFDNRFDLGKFIVSEIAGFVECAPHPANKGLPYPCLIMQIIDSQFPVLGASDILSSQEPDIEWQGHWSSGSHGVIVYKPLRSSLST